MVLEILEVEKLKREEVSDEDILRIAEIAAHPETRRYCPMYRDNPDPETRVKRISEMFDQRCSAKWKHKNNFLLLAKIVGKITGYASVQRLNMPYEDHAGSIEVTVHPEYKRRGIGSKLLQVGVESARNKGFKRLVWNVLADDKARRRLLDRSRFQLEGIRRKAINMHGKLKDEALYALLL